MAPRIYNKTRIIFVLFCIGILLLFQLHNIYTNKAAYEKQQQQSIMMTVKDANGSAKKHNGNRTEFEIGFKNVRLKCWMEFDNACPAKTKLILLTMARRDGFEKRMGIRQTWMNDSIAGEVIRFLVADPTPGEADVVQQKLADEQKEHGDLVFLHGFVDTYEHLHFKWYGGLKWQQMFCANAEWVMKADDDSMVHLRRLAHWTDKKFRPIAAQHPLVYFGIVYYDATPIRDKNHKWYVTKEMYPLDWYPNYVQGTVYLTTPATIRAILSHTREIVGFNMDDVVFTGILAELANVTLSDNKNHFKENLRLDERNVECVNGTPTAISIYGLQIMKDYEFHYAKLKTIKCTKNK